jgi:hypothetical protein
MSAQKAEAMSIRILPNTTSAPQAKLADAEVVFEAEAGPLTGLKLTGFAIWERRAGGRKRLVPGPAVLRETATSSAHEAIRAAILDGPAASRLRPDRLTGSALSRRMLPGYD